MMEGNNCFPICPIPIFTLFPPSRELRTPTGGQSNSDVLKELCR